MRLAVHIVLAAAQVLVQQLAGDAGGDHLAGHLVLEADQTAQPTAVAEALPLRGGHLFERLGLPEGLLRHDEGVLNPEGPFTNVTP